MAYDLKSIMVHGDQSILEVIKAVNETASRFALVVDEKERLIGIATDGDIRRGFLEGHNSNEPVSNIMNASPVVAKENLSRQAMLDLVNEKYNQIPVLDDQGRVKGLITFKDKSIVLDTKSRKICMLGLGYVGLTLSLVLAEVGFKVYGYDVNDEVIQNVTKGISPFHEDGLEAYLHRHIGKNLVPVSNLSAVDADVYIITVGTPIDGKTKKPRIDYIEKAATDIAARLRKDDLVVLRSTVPVGVTRNIVMPILSENSGLEVGLEYFLAYAPERTVEGRAIPEIRELPQVVGGYNEKSTMLVERLFREVTSTIIDVGSLESAEMVKILNNTFRDVKFGYANEMALICKELGLDMVKIVNAANLGYTRDRIPLPSPGVGGACLTKDPYLLIESCKGIKFQPEIVRQSRMINEFIPRKITEEILEQIEDLEKSREKIKIFIIGFAFKGEPETSDMRGSTTIDLLNNFKENGVKEEC
ncbi:MAG: nucleotide sugar dehydrogenase, partial [Syntrophaceae bacterium]|nr:nucleotide sugar dehydrogenase [Syntrophaceae bacterium]